MLGRKDPLQQRLPECATPPSLSCTMPLRYTPLLAASANCGIVRDTGSEDKHRIGGGMAGSVRLGHLFGIPLAIHYTWLIAAGLATATLSLTVFPFDRPGLPAPVYWLVGASASALFFSSVVAHELCHTLVARHFGIPVRGITLFVFGGISTIAREARKPAHELLIATAGPACSLTLFVTLFALQRFMQPHWALGGRVVFYLSLANLFFTLFNLIPALPLDGGRALRAAIWYVTGSFRLATKIAATLGHLLGFGLIGLALFTIASYGEWVLGGLLIVLGWFVHSAAEMAQQNALNRELTQGVTLRDVPKSDIAFVAPDTLLETLVYDYLLADDAAPSLLAVMRHGTLLGMVTAKEIRQVPSVHWSHTQAQDVMIESAPQEFLALTTPLEDALEHMEVGRLAYAVVANGDEEQLEVISYNDMVHFLHRRREELRKGIAAEHS